MKKILFGLGTLLFAFALLLIAGRPLEAKADGEHTAHCICGLEVTEAGQTNPDIAEAANHSCAAVTWTAWTSTEALPTYTDCANKGGENYFYLTENVTIGRWRPAAGVTTTSMSGTKIIICLNGKTVHFTDGTVAISVNTPVNGSNKNVTDVDVTVTDCSETPGAFKLAASNTNMAVSGALFTSGGERTHFTLYKGTLDANGHTATGQNLGTIAEGGGLIYFHQANSTVTIYGGTVTGGTFAPGANAKAPTTASGGGNIACRGTVTMYGGTVEDGKVTVTTTSRAYDSHGGGNILCKTFNMYGGTITNGKVTVGAVNKPTYGGNVYAIDAVTVSSGSTIEKGSIEKTGGNNAYGGNIFAGNGMTMTGGTITLGTVTKTGANYAGGGNLYIAGKPLNMSGGIVSNGTVNNGTSKEGFGGNIGTFSQTINISGTAVIEDGQILQYQEATGSLIGSNLGSGGNAVLNISGGTISGGNQYSVDLNGTSTSAAIHISGGTIETAGTGAVHVPKKGCLTIEGSAKLIGTGSYVVRMENGAKGTMSGGCIRGNCANAFFLNISSSETELSEFTMTGGVIFNEPLDASSNAVFINGGTTYIHAIFEMNGGKVVSKGAKGGRAFQNSGYLTVNGGDLIGGLVTSSRSDEGLNEVNFARTFINGGYYSNVPGESNNLIYDESSKLVAFNHAIAYNNGITITTDETNYTIIPTADPNLQYGMIIGEKFSVYYDGTFDTTLPYFADTKVAFKLGNDDVVYADPEAHGSGFRYLFSDISPERVVDTVKASLVAVGDDGAYYTLYEGDDYSMQGYLNAITPENPEEGSAEEALANLIESVLDYSSMAQLYFGYDTENLANPNFNPDSIVITALTAPTGPAMAMTGSDTYAIPTTAQEAALLPGYFKAATVIYENEVWLRIRYKVNTEDKTVADGHTTFTLNGTPINAVPGTDKATGEDDYSELFLCTGALTPTDYNTVFTFAAYYDNGLVATLDYSVNTYCADRCNEGNGYDDKLAYLLYTYGVNATAYAATQAE